MKAILKEKWRYISIRIGSEQTFTKEEFEKGLTNAFLRLLGEIGFAKVMPRIIIFDKHSAIIRVRRDGIEEAKVALALINNLNGISTHLQTTYISGTIRKSKTKIRG